MDSPLHLSQMLDLSPEDNIKIRSGIPLFELRLPRRSITNKEIYGPFDVIVSEDEDVPLNAALASRFFYKWRNNRDAYILYRVDNHGNGVAYMPDDPWWHNRLYLVEAENAVVTTMRGRGGVVIPGTEVMLEIGCLRDAIKEMKPIYKVMRDGKEICFKWDKAEAQEEIDMEKGKEGALKFSPGSKQIVPVQTRSHKWDIEKGEKLDYKDSVKELIDTYGPRGRHHMEFGWTQCQTFMEKIKPEVIKNIKKKKETIAGAGAPVDVDIFGQISQMSPEQIATLRNMLFAGETPPAASTKLTAPVDSGAPSNVGAKAPGPSGDLPEETAQ